MGFDSVVSVRGTNSSIYRAMLLLAALVPSVGAAQEFPNIEPGHWYEVPDSKLSSVAASPSPGGKIQNIMDAWSGGALDTKRKQFLVWGGGHSDYAGNEVYAFDLVTLKWKRLSEPSVPNDSSEATYPDGQPRARHTYNYIEYVPSIDRLVSFGGSAPWPRGGGGFTFELSEFDFEKASWTTGARKPVGPDGGIKSIARYDSATGNVFYIPSGNGPVQRYNPIRDEWTDWSASNTSIHASAAIDPVRRLLVLVGAQPAYAPRQAYMWNLDRQDPRTKLIDITTGDTSIESTNAPGFDFHGPTGMFVGWREGRYLYILNPDTWVWTRVEPPATSVADPGAPALRGTYGRFRYYADKDVFVLVNGVNRNVFLYRPGWAKSDKGPTIDIKSNVAAIDPGQTAAITWTSQGAASCSAEGAWSGTRPLSGSEQVGPLDQTSTFALRCTDAKGFSSLRQVSVAVDTSGTLAVVNLTSDRTVVESGGFVNLGWQTSNVTGCTASGDWTGERATQGSESFGPVTEALQFSLSCKGPAGTVSDSAAVSLVGPPVVNLSTTPNVVSLGMSSKISWEAENASNCMADGDWYGPKPLDGVETTGPLSQAATFELKCDGPGGSTSRKVTVSLADNKTDTEPRNDQGLRGGGSLDRTALGLILALLAMAARRQGAAA